MDCFQQRRKDSQDNLQKDIELLKNLEDQFRYSDNPKEKSKLEKDIEEIKQRIDYSQEEKTIIATEPFTYHELEIIIRLILSTPPVSYSLDFNVISINEKMKKNELTKRRRWRIDF